MLRLHFDYPSPASAVALLRLQRLADVGYAVDFVGLDVLGLNVALPPTLDQLDELSRYHDRAVELGLPMRRPSRNPPTLAAHLVGELADRTGLGASWRWTCLKAYWTDDVDLSDENQLAVLAAAAGLDEVTLRDLLADPVARRSLRGGMASRRRRGVGGVPVLETAGGAFVPADLPDDDLEQLASL